MNRLRTRGWKLGLALGVALVLSLGAAAPALALPIIIGPVTPLFPIFPLQWMTGTCKDAGTTAPIQGVVVSGYNATDGSYAWSTVTGADGKYSLFLVPGDYKLQFRDPLGRYGEQWTYNQANMVDSSSGTLASGVNFDWGDIQLRQAATIKTIVRRAGHPLTVLPGQFIMLQQKSGVGTVQQWSATTGGAGTAAWSALRTFSVTYKESAIDPTGRFYAGDSSAGWHAVVGGATTVTYAELFPAGASREITPTVPAAKSSQKRGRSFKVTGKFSKSIANGSQIKVLAVKGSTTKTFGGKIKSGGYSANVKLAKGTWKLYALFGGNSAYAANDSLNSKTVKVK
jgi:hypothetical protein